MKIIISTRVVATTALTIVMAIILHINNVGKNSLTTVTAVAIRITTTKILHIALAVTREHTKNDLVLMKPRANFPLVTSKVHVQWIHVVITRYSLAEATTIMGLINDAVMNLSLNIVMHTDLMKNMTMKKKNSATTGNIIIEVKSIKVIFIVMYE